MINVELSKATTGMVIAELVNRKNDKGMPLFMAKSILTPSGQQQLMCIIPNLQIHTEVLGEEE